MFCKVYRGSLNGGGGSGWHSLLAGYGTEIRRSYMIVFQTDLLLFSKYLIISSNKLLFRYSFYYTQRGACKDLFFYTKLSQLGAINLVQRFPAVLRAQWPILFPLWDKESSPSPSARPIEWNARFLTGWLLQHVNALILYIFLKSF